MLEKIAYSDRLLAKPEIGRLHSTHPLVICAKDVHAKARILGNTAEAYDGIFLSVCAQYEQTVRDLIDEFIRQLRIKIPQYNNLPPTIRQYYPKGCAAVLINIGQDKFQHITPEMIMTSLASCVKCSAKKPSTLLSDAFSHHERNLNSDIIEEIFNQRLGFGKIWGHLARQTTLSTHLGAANKETTEKRARETLNTTIKHRNNVIHRGRSFCHTGELQVREASRFLSVLIDCLATVMEKHLAAL